MNADELKAKQWALLCQLYAKGSKAPPSQHYLPDCAAWHQTFNGRCLNCGHTNETKEAITP